MRNREERRMKPLLIIAHPRATAEESHTRHGFEHAKSRLEAAEVEYAVIDLYEEKFDPVMRRKPSVKHLAQLEKYRALIDDADKILIHYPIWWNGPPAILKGFFDCMLEPGWAYHYYKMPINKVGLPIGHLKGKRAAIISTSGALDILHRLVQHSRAGRVVGHDILNFVGMRTKRFNTGGCQEFDKNNCTRIERSVDRALRWLRLP